MSVPNRLTTENTFFGVFSNWKTERKQIVGMVGQKALKMLRQMLMHTTMRIYIRNLQTNSENLTNTTFYVLYHTFLADTIFALTIKYYCFFF